MTTTEYKRNGEICSQGHASRAAGRNWISDPIQSSGVLREVSEASLRCHARLRALRPRQRRGNSQAGPTRPRRPKNKHPNPQKLLLTTNQNRESRSRPTVPDLNPANPTQPPPTTTADAERTQNTTNTAAKPPTSTSPAKQPKP
ncbi:hypothetical protein RHGRI_011680 [Rhododendron griersonianum]|uniref:Uncharacterized protein n=1 Tax=Rhododendron griersonianum TaxID=479676 RepID=A0AAV6KN80_9ERIC|nr:hypothetical protein RHGRI_011680 [Rhododendron griersonianum]